MADLMRVKYGSEEYTIPSGSKDELFIVPIDYSTLTQNPSYPDYDMKTGDLVSPYTYDEIVSQKEAGKIICAKVVNFWGSGYADTGFIAPMNFVKNSFLAYYPFADWDNTEYDMCYLTVTIRKSGTDTKADVQYDNFGNPSKKQDTLVSGTNIKTVNNQSILGSGNLDVGSNFVADGDWRYKINPDNTFEAYYSKTGVAITITNASGSLYRSELMTLMLPNSIATKYAATVLHASVNVAHNNYPAFGLLASVSTNQVKYYAMSGGSRTQSPNYMVTAHVFGTLA